MANWFYLTYRGERVCRLSRVLGYWAEGGRAVSRPFVFRRSGEATRLDFDRLHPGDRIELSFIVGPRCSPGLFPQAPPGARGAKAILLRFVPGSRRVVDLETGTCDVRILPEAAKVDPSLKPYPIDFRLVQEESTRPKRVLHYALILRNTSRRTITLSRCPVFVEDLEVDPKATSRELHRHERHRLACGSHRVMRPHESVRYELEIHVPRTPAGPVRDAELFVSFFDDHLSTGVDLTRLFDRA
jgi:hypothetical protein